MPTLIDVARLGEITMNLLIFPNQLFANHPGLSLKPQSILLVEDSLFFGDKRYPAQFHKQKLWLHRSTMKRYEADLASKGHSTLYQEYAPASSIRETLSSASTASKDWITLDPVDFVLKKRLLRVAEQLNLKMDFLPNPGFLTTHGENSDYRSGKKRWFMADYYKWQRLRLNILVEGTDPTGGKWSFDSENRKKIPKAILQEIPDLQATTRDDFDREARSYVNDRFASNPGNLDSLYYPTSHPAARKWLKQFLRVKLERFGDYEDAIQEGESWLWHSVLTPCLNIGLLTPDEIVEATLLFHEENPVPLNSLEGFLRQIIGWREFMRATYEDLGTPMRTTNHWNHHRSIPESFYSGTTGIAPIDDTILRLQDTGYCHHIERLMVLDGFMFLCEIDPDEIYRWFMEMFVDSYDWVMVPNVYAMSQNADGGLITTKPYFSGSSYIRKMSHYKKAPWCEIWDGLYWRWIWNHVETLGKNPRWAMMCSSAKKMDDSKRQKHIDTAESFLAQL